MTVDYGTVSLIEGYKGGAVVTRTRTIEESIEVTSKQHLVQNIFDELEKLEDVDEICFRVYADKHTRHPYRMVLVTKEPLDLAK